MEDEAIIELYWRRDERAVAETRSRYGARLNRLAFGIVQSAEDAEECENDAYLHTWQSIPPQRPQYFFAYLAKLCRNAALPRMARRSLLLRARRRCVVDTAAFRQRRRPIPKRLFRAAR